MWRALLVIGLLCICASAQARPRKDLQYLGENTGDAVVLDRARPFAYGTGTEPAWLPAALTHLKNKQPPGTKLEQHLLFHNGKTPTFLAAVWKGDNRHFALYQIRSVSPFRVKVVQSLQDEYMKLVEPSGMNSFGDGVAAPLFVEQGSGGSGFDGYRLFVFRLDKTATDVSPPLRPVWAEDLDGDGIAEIGASDDRWGSFFHGCGQCGPLVMVVHRWRHGQYVPACRDFPDLLAARIDLMRIGPDKVLSDAWEVGYILVSQALDHLQMGNAALAQARYQDALQLLAALRAGPEGAEAEKILNRTRAGFDTLFAQADTLAQAPCPVEAGDGGGHYGLKDRINRYRPSGGSASP